jgi:hypothetical protein
LAAPSLPRPIGVLKGASFKHIPPHRVALDIGNPEAPYALVVIGQLRFRAGTLACCSGKGRRLSQDAVTARNTLAVRVSGIPDTWSGFRAG